MNPLADLYDIHLPPAISHWPLTPAWILLALLLCIASMVITYKLIPRWRHYLIRRYTIKQLQALQQAWIKTQDTALTLSALSILLRRAALAAYPRQQVAGLTGQAWLEFLDKTGKTDAFTQGTGKFVGDLPYQKTQTAPVEPLFELIRQWIKRAL